MCKLSCIYVCMYLIVYVLIIICNSHAPRGNQLIVDEASVWLLNKVFTTFTTTINYSNSKESERKKSVARYFPLNGNPPSRDKPLARCLLKSTILGKVIYEQQNRSNLQQIWFQ